MHGSHYFVQLPSNFLASVSSLHIFCEAPNRIPWLYPDTPLNSIDAPPRSAVLDAMLEVLKPLGAIMRRPEATTAPPPGARTSASSTAEGAAAIDQDGDNRLPVELFTLRALASLLEVGLLMDPVHDLQKRCPGIVPCCVLQLYAVNASYL